MKPTQITAQAGSEPSESGAQKSYAPYHSPPVLRWVAGILAAVALIQSVFYLGMPWLPVGKRTLAVARKCLIPAREVGDFDFLSAQPIWQDQKLHSLLSHADLANYNRQPINWQVDDTVYRDYVLSPVITGNRNGQINWRRPLWEEFYPRIRHESSPEDAAKIAVRHLRERVSIAVEPNLPHDVPGIWWRQITDETGFEIIYVAALRFVGVPARLDAQRHAELWTGDKWQLAPRPSVVSL